MGINNDEYPLPTSASPSNRELLTELEKRVDALEELVEQVITPLSLLIPASNVKTINKALSALKKATEEAKDVKPITFSR